MNLFDIVSKIDSFNDDQTIYSAPPWNSESESLVAVEPNNSELPLGAAEINARYFLEVSIAKEIIEEYSRLHDYCRTDDEKCARLISYALNDA